MTHARERPGAGWGAVLTPLAWRGLSSFRDGSPRGTAVDAQFQHQGREDLRGGPQERGVEGKAARIANASAALGRTTVAARGGRSPAYEDMTKDDLYDRAKTVGITGRSRMTKPELIDALRHH